MSTNREILMKFITGQTEKARQDVSMQGYKDDSPYRNNPSNTIYGSPEGTSITMEGVSTPLVGTDEFGNRQEMFPGQKYEYPGSRVVETPMAKYGGLLNKTIKCSNCGWSWKAADGGNDVSTCHKCGNENTIIESGGEPKPGEKDFQKVMDWYNKYTTSPRYLENLIKSGYKDPQAIIDERLANINTTKFKHDESRLGSYYRNNKIHYSPIKDQENFPGDEPDSTFAHEFGHSSIDTGKSIFDGFKAGYNRYDFEQLKNRNKNPKISRGEHENYADLKAIQYEAEKQGLYKAGYDEFTEEILDKLKDSGLKKRLLNNFSKKDIIWLQNNLAQNNNNKYELPVAQVGGENMYTVTGDQPIIIPSQGSYPTSYQYLPDNMQPIKVPRKDVNGIAIPTNILRENQKEYNRQRMIQPEYEYLNRMFDWMEENNATEKDWLKKLKKDEKENSKYHQQENTCDPNFDPTECGISKQHAKEDKAAFKKKMQGGTWFGNADEMSVSNKYQEAGTVKKPKLGAGKYYTTTDDIVDWGTPEYEKAYNRGEVLSEDGVRSEVTLDGGKLDEVVIKNNYKNGFWENYRDKIIEEGEGSGVLGAIIGVPINAITSLPQLALMNELTGKVQRPSEAWGFENNKGWFDSPSSFGKNLANFTLDAVTDPADWIGVGELTTAGRLAKSKLRKTFPGSISPELREGLRTNGLTFNGTPRKYPINNYQRTANEDVDRLFKEFPELEKIGSKEDYIKYLETIQPETTQPGIFYRGSKNQSHNPSEWTPNPNGGNNLGEGFYFTPDPFKAEKYGKEAKALLNIKDPTYTSIKLNMNGLSVPKGMKTKDLVGEGSAAISIENPNRDLFTELGSEAEGYMRKYIGPLDEQGFPIAIRPYENYPDFVDYSKIDEIAVPNNSQIHVLGSDADLELFKKHMSNNANKKEGGITKYQQAGTVNPTNTSDKNTHTREMAERVVQLAEERIRNNNYVDVPKEIEDIAKARGESAFSCIGGVCTVLKDAGVMDKVDWSNTHFSENAKEYGFTANQGWGVKGIENLEPGDVLQYSNKVNKEGNYYPGHSQIYLGKDASGQLRFFDNFWGTERTKFEDDVKELLDRSRKKTELSATIYKVNPYDDSNPLGLTPEEKKNYDDKQEFIEKESKSKASYKWSISPTAKNYNDTTQRVMDNFIAFANDNDKINDLVKKTGKSKAEIQDSLLNVFGELGVENNWTTSKGKGLGSRLENIAESVLTSVGGGKKLSVGPGQIKYNSIPEDLREKFNIQSPNDLYDLDKVLPLMTAMDLRDKQVLENWGEDNKLSKNLFGWTRPATTDNEGNIISGGFTADQLASDTGTSLLDNGVGRYSPYLRNQYSSIASGTTFEGGNDWIPFNEGTMPNFTEGRFTKSGQDEMRVKYERDPGSYPYKVEQNWRDNLNRFIQTNADGAVELNEVVISRPKKT